MGMIVQLIVLLHVLVIKGELEDGISYVVDAGKRDCFYRDIDAGYKMDFDLQVLSGGDMDISVVIKSPSGKVLLTQDREAEVSQEISVEEKGSHEICFDNTFSTFSEKIVYFDLGINDYDTGHEEISKGFTLPKDAYENIDQIWNSLDKLGNHFDHVSNLQTVFRSKYKRHEWIQESNLKKVTWFSLGSSIVMIFIGILQVVMIKKLFK